MENVLQLETFVTVLLWLCGSVVAVAGAVAVVVKFWKWAHKDTEKNTDNINDIHEWLGSDKRRIENLEKRQDESEQMNRLQLKALFTLLGHEIDGNYTESLKEVRDEINTYLIEK